MASWEIPELNGIVKQCEIYPRKDEIVRCQVWVPEGNMTIFWRRISRWIIYSHHCLLEGYIIHISQKQCMRCPGCGIWKDSEFILFWWVTLGHKDCFRDGKDGHKTPKEHAATCSQTWPEHGWIPIEVFSWENKLYMDWIGGFSIDVQHSLKSP